MNSIWYPHSTFHLLPESCYGKQLRFYDGIIFHHISAVNVLPDDPYNYEAIRQIFIADRVSAHFLVRRDGSVVQLVPLDLEAWHAGRSHLNGRDYCNKFCFGIELEATPDDVFTGEQYVAAAELTSWLVQEFKIPPTMIDTHRNVREAWNKKHPFHTAPRKFDPNKNWDMVKLKSMVRGLLPADKA